jgi:hypothetical protein
MAGRDVAYASSPTGGDGTIFCITSPGVVHDLQQEADGSNRASNQWINTMQYADAMRIANREVGAYHNVRFVETNDAILFNCGEITAQTHLSESHTAGEGSPDPATTTVDGAYHVGQPSKQHWLQVDDVTGFAVHDIISVHLTRTSDFGITNGADHRDGTKEDHRIVAIDVGNDRLVLDKPIMQDFTVDLGGSVYGYVTSGRHVHTAIFVGAPTGVVLGVNQPPKLHTPPNIDDVEAMHRFSWDAYLRYQLFEPEVFEVAFLSGSYRQTGPVSI